MRCPNCGNENNDDAKFCKKCGTPLKKEINHNQMINSMDKGNSDNTTKYIIIALAIIAVVLAGAFVYIYGFGSNQSNDSQPNQIDNSLNVNQSNDEPKTAQASEPVQQSTPSSISILGGSFSTGSAESDKTYARINVGTAHAGENVIVQIFYSRDGNALNHGNMVPATVHSDGYLEIASADAYHYYPDYATIKIYDSNSNLLTTQSVALSPTSGTQTF
ncbi:zinc ribbon domain-containing protein [Methanobrevibacter sp.]|uniref:zinc ribbon domain-containing protein n=1 Tax=Methanobrevibacter sp. TaxID=66852 RepID=UPI0025CD2666|nr:zinc ribbon domain-containing protein [Methanobrevibacter sp.]MBQ2666061.1 zinc-ribbon domain-containing protein [Methanobrevibacter sp.]